MSLSPAAHGGARRRTVAHGGARWRTVAHGGARRRMARAGGAHFFGCGPPGAPVTLHAQSADGQLDALFVDANGLVNVMWVQGEGAWQGPTSRTMSRDHCSKPEDSPQLHPGMR
jgi:hypothetical protein